MTALCIAIAVDRPASSASDGAKGSLKRLAAFIRAKLPSGLFEPLGLLSLRHLLGRLWSRLWLLLFCHTAVVPQ
jgi:hypothetical protein